MKKLVILAAILLLFCVGSVAQAHDGSAKYTCDSGDNHNAPEEDGNYCHVHKCKPGIETEMEVNDC